MTQFLLLKEHIKNIYQKYSSLFHLFLRFVMGFLTFLSINRVVGYQPKLNHLYVEILLGFVTMIMPVEIMV
ncbi:MAG: ABC transporter permease, partial [Lachnospiraceae bacterium]|nr:ABC transporter permease [Lachnospiraceae bacterium]